MDRDSKLILEAMYLKEEHVSNNYTIKQLYKILDELGKLSTAIHLSHQPEIDQILSKIRDMADMLISDNTEKAEDSEMAAGAELPAGSGAIQPRLS